MMDRHGTVAMDCCGCGVGIPIGDAPAEDDEFTCKDCGAACVVFIDDTHGNDEAYFGSWKCKHGVDGDEACDACEAEENAA